MLFLRQPLHTASGGSALDLVLGPRPRKQSLSGVWLDFIVEGKGIMSHRLSLKLSSRKSKPNVIASFQRWWASASVPGGGGDEEQDKEPAGHGSWHHWTPDTVCQA